MESSEPLYYFAYGSNLALQQMSKRCPNSTFYDFGVLRNYRWIISERGYANVINKDPKADGFEHTIRQVGHEERLSLLHPDLKLELPSSKYEHEVQGLLFTLAAEDEEALDRAEGVPISYQKHLRWIYITSLEEHEAWKRVLALVYIDSVRVKDGVCKHEYVARINRGVRDAMAKGMEASYVEKYIRPFVSEEEIPDHVEDPFFKHGK